MDNGLYTPVDVSPLAVGILLRLKVSTSARAPVSSTIAAAAKTKIGTLNRTAFGIQVSPLRVSYHPVIRCAIPLESGLERHSDAELNLTRGFIQRADRWEARLRPLAAECRDPKLCC